MKSKTIKVLIIVFVIICTMVLLILSGLGILPQTFQITMGDAMQIMVLTFVSYFLVARDNEDSRKKDAIIRLIVELQKMLSDFSDILYSSNDNKITRVELTNISNYIEILSREIKDNNSIDIIKTNIDNLSGIVLDHIDDEEYIKKSHNEVFRLISSINTALEQIAFEVV